MREFIQRYQRIILLVGFFLLVLLMAYGLYVLFFKPTPPPPDAIDETPIAVPGLPIAEPGGPQIIPEPTPTPIAPPTPPITPDEVAQGGVTNVNPLDFSPNLSPTLSANGSDLQYYNTLDGKFYRLDNEGNLQELADRVFYNVEKVTWSPLKNKAILEYPDGSNIIYDFDEKKQITLPKHFEDFQFSPQGENLVMKSIGLDEKNRWLITSNSDGSRIKTVEPLGNNADMVIPSWSPNNQTIAMYLESVDFDRQEVYFIGQNNENFKSMIVHGRGFEHEWSPSGDRLLYSAYSSLTDYKPALWLSSAQGDNIGANRQFLQIETWAHKCTFADGVDVYCAVPTELPAGAGMMPELAADTEDLLYKINTQTGAKQLIAIPDGYYNMQNIMVSENGYYLYFTDAISGGIHQIKIK